MSRLEGNQDKDTDKHSERTPQTSPITFNARPETIEALRKLAAQLGTDIDGAVAKSASDSLKKIEAERRVSRYEPDEEPPPDGNEE